MRWVWRPVLMTRLGSRFLLLRPQDPLVLGPGCASALSCPRSAPNMRPLAACTHPEHRTLHARTRTHAHTRTRTHLLGNAREHDGDILREHDLELTIPCPPIRSSAPSSPARHLIAPTNRFLDSFSTPASPGAASAAGDSVSGSGAETRHDAVMAMATPQPSATPAALVASTTSPQPRSRASRACCVS